MFKTIAVGVIGAVLIVVSILVSPRASASIIDKSPGVVTRWEFRHLPAGSTRAEVREFYGVHGHHPFGFWGEDGNFYLSLQYPTRHGGTTYVTFIDRHDTAHYVLRWRYWYHPDGSVETFGTPPR